MMLYRLAFALVFLVAVQMTAHAGDLYDDLIDLSDRKIMFTLFEKTSFDKYDIEDLDRLWIEKDYSTEFVVSMFERHRKKFPESMNAYQEVILWHTEIDVIASNTSKEEFDLASSLLHEKSALFGGTVRVIGGFLDDSKPYRKGICRWIAPNTFVMLYVVRLAREPFFGPVFPMDGGTKVSQTLH